DPSVLEIRAKARRWASDPTVPRGDGHLRGMILVDYVQLVKSGAGRRDDSREREIAEVSRGLKALAKDLHMPIVALAQLNRGLEKREDKRPILSDLRESGGLEQDADVVMFIYRDDYYNREKSEKPGVAEIMIGKHRNGPTGTVDLRWSGEHTRFDNLSLREDCSAIASRNAPTSPAHPLPLLRACPWRVVRHGALRRRVLHRRKRLAAERRHRARVP